MNNHLLEPKWKSTHQSGYSFQGSQLQCQFGRLGHCDYWALHLIKVQNTPRYEIYTDGLNWMDLIKTFQKSSHQFSQRSQLQLQFGWHRHFEYWVLRSRPQMGRNQKKHTKVQKLLYAILCLGRIDINGKPYSNLTKPLITIKIVITKYLVNMWIHQNHQN